MNRASVQRNLMIELLQHDGSDRSNGLTQEAKNRGIAVLEAKAKALAS